MIAVQVGRIGLGCDFYKNEGCFCKIFGVRHASAFSRGVRGGEQGRVGFNQADLSYFRAIRKCIEFMSLEYKGRNSGKYFKCTITCILY